MNNILSLTEKLLFTFLLTLLAAISLNTFRVITDSQASIQTARDTMRAATIENESNDLESASSDENAICDNGASACTGGAK